MSGNLQSIPQPFSNRNTNIFRGELDDVQKSPATDKSYISTFHCPPFIASLSLHRLSDVPIEVVTSCINLADLELPLVLFELKIRSREVYCSPPPTLFLFCSRWLNLGRFSGLSKFNSVCRTKDFCILRDYLRAVSHYQVENLPVRVFIIRFMKAYLMLE